MSEPEEPVGHVRIHETYGLDWPLPGAGLPAELAPEPDPEPDADD